MQIIVHLIFYDTYYTNLMLYQKKDKNVFKAIASFFMYLLQQES